MGRVSPLGIATESFRVMPVCICSLNTQVRLVLPPPGSEHFWKKAMKNLLG